MTGEVRTNGGLTLRNYTRYDTQTLLAIVNEFERRIAPDGKVVIDEWAPNGVVAFVHASGAQPERTKGGRGAGRALKAYAAPRRSSRSGTVTIVHPKDVFDNPVEALAAEIADEKLAPIEVTLDVLRAMSVAYSQRCMPTKAIYDDGAWPRIWITDKPAMKRPRDGKSGERREQTRKVNRAAYAVGSACFLLRNALTELGQAGATEYEAELLRLRAQLADLRDRIGKARLNYVPPTLNPSQDKDN
jgi:hypothetical protein